MQPDISLIIRKSSIPVSSSSSVQSMMCDVKEDFFDQGLKQYRPCAIVCNGHLAYSHDDQACQVNCKGTRMSKLLIRGVGVGGGGCGVTKCSRRYVLAKSIMCLF